MSEKAHYGLLKGKKGVVFGPLDESSIGWQIALHAYRTSQEEFSDMLSRATTCTKFKKIEGLLDENSNT